MKKKVLQDIRKTLQGGAHGSGHDPRSTDLQAGNGGGIADSKREAEKLIKSKASSYTTVKKRASNLMEILNNTEDNQAGSAMGGADGSRKRGRKRLGKNALGSARNSQLATSNGNKRQKTH